MGPARPLGLAQRRRTGKSSFLPWVSNGTLKTNPSSTYFAVTVLMNFLWKRRKRKAGIWHEICLARVRQDGLGCGKAQQEGGRKGQIQTSLSLLGCSAGTRAAPEHPHAGTPCLHSHQCPAGWGLSNMPLDNFIALKICELVPLCSFFYKRGMHFGCWTRTVKMGCNRYG